MTNTILRYRHFPHEEVLKHSEDEKCSFTLLKEFQQRYKENKQNLDFLVSDSLKSIHSENNADLLRKIKALLTDNCC